ncbi:uncharacterized protein LOC121378533 [Gigantopelta aegis]|uniref:uncharacterized protein LOC121378533 n=1 Tax=Gigantopelta aegis TaxID=1735272 RepID=UPI001B88A3E8|nr:uncharacterized protein LOC121378533 [Gigantopelta aegis]
MSRRESREEHGARTDHPRNVDSRADMIQNAATEVPPVNGQAATSKEGTTTGVTGVVVVTTTAATTTAAVTAMDSGLADGSRPVMEGTEEFIKPIVKDGEIILEVECGQNKALLYLSKLCQGSKGPCIFYQGSWLTPNEFQFVSGRETAKDWKRSIRHHGKSLKLLLAKGILTVHPTVCECEGCRHSSTTPTRCRNGEKRSRMSSSTSEVKGKGSSSPVEHHVNGAFKPVQHVRPQIRIPSGGTDSHVVGQKQQEKIGSAMSDGNASTVCQDLRPVEKTSSLSDKSDHLPVVIREKTQDRVPVLKANTMCKNDTAPFKVNSVHPEKTSFSDLKPVSELAVETKKDGCCQQTKHRHSSSHTDKLKHKSSKTQSAAGSTEHKKMTTTTTTTAAAATAETQHTSIPSLQHVPEVKSDPSTETKLSVGTECKSQPLAPPTVQGKSHIEKDSPSSSASKVVNQPCPALQPECVKDVQCKSNGVPSIPEPSTKQQTAVVPGSPDQPKPPSGDRLAAPAMVPSVERVKPTPSANDKCQRTSEITIAKSTVKTEQLPLKDVSNGQQGKDHKDDNSQKELKHTCGKEKGQSAKPCAKVDSGTKSESSDSTKVKLSTKPIELDVKNIKHEDSGSRSSHSKHKQTDKKHSTDKDSHVQSSTSSSSSSSAHHKSSSSSHVRSPDTAATTRKREDYRPSLPMSDNMAVPRIGSDVPPMMQQDATDAACSDYMRLLASGHGHPMLPPHIGAFDPLYALRFQEYPITPAALYPHSGLLPGDQMLYQNTPGMMPNVGPPCFAPSIQMYQPRLPYAIPMQLTDPLKPLGCLPYPSAAVYPCSLNGLKRKQYETEQTSESPQKRLCTEYSSPAFQMDGMSQSYAFGPSVSEASRLSYGDEYNLRKYCEDKYLCSETSDAQVFSRWSELAAKTGYCRLCSCTNSRPNDIRFWSVEDVCRFLARLDGCGIYAENFMEQRVDGRILPLLTTDHLIKNLGMKLGPAVLLTEAVAKKIQEAGKLLTCESCRGLLPGPVV